MADVSASDREGVAVIMCGIAGIYDQAGRKSVEERGLAAMLRTMPHRGLDASGIWRGADGVDLAHVRLAIIDLHYSQAHQGDLPSATEPLIPRPQ